MIREHEERRLPPAPAPVHPAVDAEHSLTGEAVPGTEEITCDQCRHVKPLEDFDPWPDMPDHRESVCRVCKARNALDAVRSVAVHEAERRLPAPPETVRIGLPVVQAIIDRDVDPANIHDLADGMMGRFNGLPGFCDFWAVQLTYAAANKPGSKTVLDGCRHLAGLVHQSSQLRQQAGDVSNMSEADLERVLLDHLSRTNPNDTPQLAATAPASGRG